MYQYQCLNAVSEAGLSLFPESYQRTQSMEEADVLYGVTMQERGVSKLLELRASEVEEKLGIQVDKG